VELVNDPLRGLAIPRLFGLGAGIRCSGIEECARDADGIANGALKNGLRRGNDGSYVVGNTTNRLAPFAGIAGRPVERLPYCGGDSV
jgi:hypothetical protein